MNVKEDVKWKNHNGKGHHRGGERSKYVIERKDGSSKKFIKMMETQKETGRGKKDQVEPNERVQS